VKEVDGTKVKNVQQKGENYRVNTATAIVLRPLYRSTCFNWHIQLRTGGFCWCKVLLPAALADGNWGCKTWSHSKEN